MRLHILGNNGPFPAAGGACSGYLAETSAGLIQLDLGTGVLSALTRLADPERLTALVFSHWHFDHCSDALPLLYRIQNSGIRLKVYGPADPASPVRSVLAGFRAVELTDLVPGETLTMGPELTLEVFPAKHPVPAVMLRLRDGGRTLCYTGDTNLQPGLADYARDADLLLADGLFTRDRWGENKPHLAAAQCAEIAAEAGVKQLVITHLHPAIPEDKLLAEARTAYPRAQLARLGAVFEL